MQGPSRRRLLQLCLACALASSHGASITETTEERQLKKKKKESSSAKNETSTTDAQQNDESAAVPAVTMAPTKHEKDWKDHMLECFNDMKHADKNEDDILTESEYLDFANRYGNRIFVTQDVVARQKHWQLEELLEELILEDPFAKGSHSGLSIYGARIITRNAMDEKETRFLQKICNQSEKVLRLIGPKQARADRAGEKCDLHENKIKYYGTAPPKTTSDEQEEAVHTHAPNTTYDEESDMVIETIEGTLEGNTTLIIETFHDQNPNNTWVQEHLEDGTTIEFWNDHENETITDLPDDDEIWVYENPVIDALVDSISGLFGFDGEDEDAVLELEEEEYEARNGEEGDERQRHLRYVTRHEHAPDDEEQENALIEGDFAEEDYSNFS